MGANDTYQKVAFKVPLLHREKELRFMVGRTLEEEEGCIKVKEAHDEAGNRYLLKLVLRGTMEGLKHSAAVMRRLNTDMGIMKLLDSRYITKLYQVFISDDVVYILLEYTPTSLKDFIAEYPNGLPVEMAKDYFQQLCKSVEFLHDRALAHRNITSSAVKLDETKEMLKLGGFGCACLQNSKEHLYDHPVVDDTYASPEMRGDNSYNGKQTDIWSLGCVLYEMLTGEPYTKGCDLEAGLVGGASEVLHMMLETDPSARGTLQEVMGNEWVHIRDIGVVGKELLARHGSIEDLEAYTDSELKANFKRIGTGLGLDMMCQSPDLMDSSFSPLMHRSGFTLLETPADPDLAPTWSEQHKPPSFELSPHSSSPASKLKSRLTVDILANATQTDTKVDFSPMHRTRD
eukprot:TRINITY_DN20928_c0_g2_i1.p1 TRINITY_DN20928_c0_g2~~TRINITY_DN20928_c0_g2_i1.p1  ORF type:complete len:416 (+),score=98.72 TRINITY_DN20928_c0_g2_i1:44-1249(+)